MLAPDNRAGLPLARVTADRELESGTWISRHAGAPDTLSVR
jgi:hypothetical protein